MSLKVSEESRRIDQNLKRIAVTDKARFLHLEEAAKKRRTKGSVEVKTASKAATGWREKIAKMRETHPNAYKPWDKAQDDILKEKFQNGCSVGEIGKLLGRHEGSIVMRLQKHFGEDVGIIR